MKKTFIASIIGLTLSANVMALDKASVQAKMPGTPVTSVSPVAGFSGLYELVVGKNKIFYINENVDKMIIGHVFDLQTRRDLTNEKVRSLSVVDYKKLPFEDSFTVKKGDGSREFAVFTDPQCPFCKKLEKSLDSVTDYTMHVFMMPLTSLHPGSVKVAENIFCSSDKAKSWHDYVLRGKPVKEAKCKNPVERNIALGDSLGVTGTPALIGVNGVTKAGYMVPKDLNIWLDKNGKVSK